MIPFKWFMLFEKKYFLIISFFLVFLTCIIVSSLQGQAQNPSILSGEEKRWPSEQDINYIMKMHMFGIIKTQITKTKYNNESISCRLTENDNFYIMVPEKKNGYSVRALVISTQARYSVAVIDISGRQELFSQGDNLDSNGERIVRVLSDRVIIRKDGYCTALTFSE